MGHGQTKTYRAAWILAAGAPVAAARGVRDSRRALLDGARGLDADAAGLSGIPGAVRSAARPGVPEAVAAGLPSIRLGDVDGARRGDGAPGGGTVRPARDSRLGGRSQPPGLDDVVVARRAELKPAGGETAAQQGGAAPPSLAGSGPRRWPDGCKYPGGGRQAVRSSPCSIP